ncbi:hypothetical protein HN011_007645, partial [Eciton burchellii]
RSILQQDRISTFTKFEIHTATPADEAIRETNAQYHYQCRISPSLVKCRLHDQEKRHSNDELRKPMEQQTLHQSFALNQNKITFPCESNAGILYIMREVLTL